MIKNFKDLTEEEQEPYIELATEILDGLLYCDRVWSAWSYGTMSASDFHCANEGDIPYEKAEMLYNFIQNKMRKGKIENIINQ